MQFQDRMGELLRESLILKWQTLVADWKDSPTVSIPRSYFDNYMIEVKSYQLHGFCDASKLMLQRYILAIETSSSIHIQFVVSKTRVTSSKGQTIPRLELLSALLLA